MDSSRRARNRAACRRCQRRKIRCDGITPSCGACRKAGVDCVNDGTQEVHRSYIANMENRIKWLESVIREKCPTVDLDNGTHRIPDSFYEPADESLVEVSVQNNPRPQSFVRDEARFPYQDSRPREQSSLDNSAPVVQDEAQQAHEIGLVSLFRGEDPRYIGPSSGYFFAKRIFSNTGWRGRHGSVEAVTTGSVSHFPVELLHTPALLPQQKEVALQLSIRYFRSIHLLYPFLHEQTHMQMIDEVYRSQERDSDPISSFQIYMVLAIASLNLSRQCKQFLPVEGYYASAMKHVDYICHHGSMAALQCLLLLMVYALYNPSCRVNIWNLNYQCLASVIDLGLQRDVRASSSYPMPLFKQEMRTRVFWVVYTLDRTLCTMMGRPIGIRDEACEIRFPLDISDSDLINATANQSTSDGSPSHMSLSIRLFRLAQLNSEIKYVMHSICRDVPSYAYPPVKDIFTWQRDMMRTLEGWYDNAVQHTGDRDNGMREYCIAKYHELMILLLRPSPAIPDPADEIFDICSDHAFALLQCFGDLYEKGNLLYSRFIVHSVFLGTLVILHCIWKFPRTASKFSIDQLFSKFNIAQNILSSIGEHWAEALSARDCIAQLSNITIQRLLRNQPAAPSTSHSGGPFSAVSLRHGDIHATNLEIPVTPSSNIQGQTSAEKVGNTSTGTWTTMQPHATTPNPSSEYPNLFDDLLQTDLGEWTGMSDIDWLLSDLLNGSHC